MASVKESVNVAIEKATEEIEAALTDCNTKALQALPAMKQAIVLARGMKALTEALTKDIVEDLFMPLQGKSLGFRTDRDKPRDGGKPGYDWVVVRDCAIEAMVRGYQMVGNEVNLIDGRAYFTKEGMERRVREYPGLANLKLVPGAAKHKEDEGTARIAYRASWLFDGKPMEIVCDLVRDGEKILDDQRIEVRVNKGQGIDAILGKAKRKMLARILERLTGSQMLAGTDGDIGDVITVHGESVPVASGPAGDPPPPVPPEQDGKRVKMPSQAKNGAAHAGATGGAGAAGATGAAAQPSSKPDPSTGEVAPEHEPPMPAEQGAK